MISFCNYRPTILSLLFISRPSAIAWLIIAIIIDSLKRHPRIWLCAHIIYEVLKRLPPAVANHYASTLIVLVLLMFWIQTARLHAIPGIVFSRSSTAMCNILRSSHACLNASATFGMPADQVGSSYHCYLPALAQGLPESSPISSFRQFYDSEPPKLMSDEIQLHTSRVSRIHSKWAKQVGDRANRLAELMERG